MPDKEGLEMTEQARIKAPDGWLDYASGKHLSGDRAESFAASESDYLTFLARLERGEIDPEAPGVLSDAPWRAAEHAAIVRAENGRHWPARSAALRALEESLSDGVLETGDDWSDRVARGRYFLNYAEAVQRDGSEHVFGRANALLEKAEAAFSGIEGEDFFRAEGEVIRGRLLAWKNDVIGATASQSSALSVFQKYGNQTREAAAAYELGIANLDANLPDPARRLFDLAISAHRALNTDGAALARSLQSKARALLVKSQVAPGAEASAQFIEEAKQRAFEAFLLSAPISAPDSYQQLKPAGAPDIAEALVKHDAYRAGMAARDLGAAALREAELQLVPKPLALQQAKAWLKVTATELGQGDVFSETGQQSMRQKITSDDSVEFDILRAAQLEFEILAQTAPDEAAPLLIETGKRFPNLTYTIECFEAAAACYQTESDRTGEADLALEANYWRHRAARLALSIGARSSGDSAPPASMPDAFASDLADIRESHDFQIIRFDTATADGVFADVILSGRQTINQLILLPADVARTIDLDRLKSVSERGDIPRILSGARLKSGALCLIQETPTGRRLSETLGRSLSGATRTRLAARLCRTLASLIRAHSLDLKSASPLWITMEDIVIAPGDRAVISSFGPVGRKQAPSVGWAFLYPDADPDGARLKEGMDARALAKILILLLGVEKTQHKNLSLPSYVRRSIKWFHSTEPLDGLSFEALGALSKLANGKLKVARSFEKAMRSDADASKRETAGVPELLYLASLLDSSANTP